MYIRIQDEHNNSLCGDKGTVASLYAYTIAKWEVHNTQTTILMKPWSYEDNWVENNLSSYYSLKDNFLNQIKLLEVTKTLIQIIYRQVWLL